MLHRPQNNGKKATEGHKELKKQSYYAKFDKNWFSDIRPTSLLKRLEKMPMIKNNNADNLLKKADAFLKGRSF
jgi:hypothetical protein